MLIQIPQVLNDAQLRRVRACLDGAGSSWMDGRVTAGHQGAQVKFNEQLSEDAQLAEDLGDLILAALEQHPLFISAALPKSVYPPLFNRYSEGMEFGHHVDGAVRLVPGTGIKFRTDLSATLFLSAPHEYEGGELVIEDTYGMHSIKLDAGNMILYPASSVHCVTRITQGQRLASFFWIQSLVRDDAQRALLFDLDRSIQQLVASDAEPTARIQLSACYHNLLRMWSDV